MNSPFGLVLTFGALLLIGFGAHYFATPRLYGTERDAERFYAAASRGPQLLEALRASPEFKEIIFDDCARIENSGTPPTGLPIVFAPKGGESVKFQTVKDALDHNPNLLRESANCRKTTVIYMKNITFKGTILLELDGNWKILKAQKPVFSD